MQMSMRKLNSHTILQLWCCCHVMYKLLYPSIRVRTAPPVSVRVRVRVSVSFSFGVTPLRILICMCSNIPRHYSTGSIFLLKLLHKYCIQIKEAKIHFLTLFCRELGSCKKLVSSILSNTCNNKKLHDITQQNRHTIHILTK